MEISATLFWDISTYSYVYVSMNLDRSLSWGVGGMSFFEMLLRA